MKSVIQLLRVSTEGQASEDRYGLPAQREACRRLCAQHGLTVRHSFELSDVSGSLIMTTPEMQQMIKLLQSGQLHGIVVREFSRVLRPTNYDYYLFSIMSETRTTLYSESGVIEPWTQTGRMMVAMHGVIAANELDTIRTRMMAGKEAMRREGRWAAGTHCLPLGVAYNRNTGEFSYTPDAERVRRLFRRFLSGEHNYDLLSREAGVSRGTAANLLQNPIYSGWLVFDKRRDDRRYYKGANGNGRHRDRPKVARPESDVIRKQVIQRPLVSEADFARVQQIIKRKATAHIRARIRTGEFVYAGHVRCGRCGRLLHTQFNRKAHYYLCSGKKHRTATGETLCPYSGYLNRDKLELVLDATVQSVLGSATRLRRVVAAYRQELERASTGQDRTRLEHQLTALQRKRDRVIDAFADGAIGKADRDSRLAAIDDQLRTAESEIQRYTAQVPVWTVEQMADVVAPFVGWRTLTRREKRQLLHATFLELTVRDYKVVGVRLAGSVDASRMKMAPCPLRAPRCP